MPGGRTKIAGPGLAGQTDKGLVHPTNQDDFTLSGPGTGGDGTILVVCGGVSNSQTSELAVTTAARVAHTVLLSADGDAAPREAAMREASSRRSKRCGAGTLRHGARV